MVLTLSTLIPTIGCEVGFIKATFTVDVIGNIVLALPLWLVPLVVLWDAPGELRTSLQKGADLILVWIPFTAFSAVVYEVTFLVGNLIGIWKATNDPGWQWLWWQFSHVDTRWWGQNPYLFSLEFVAMPVGIALLLVWLRLLRTTTADGQCVRSLWLAFGGIAAQLATTMVYFISEVRTGFADIGQAWYGLAFKGIFINLPLLAKLALVGRPFWAENGVAVALRRRSSMVLRGRFLAGRRGHVVCPSLLPFRPNTRIRFCYFVDPAGDHPTR